MAKMDELLKLDGDTSIYRRMHRMEGIMAHARAEWQEQQLKSRDTSRQIDENEDVAQGNIVLKLLVNCCVDEVTSLPEERYQCTSNVHSKGNRTTVSPKSLNANGVLLLESEAMKKQEGMDEQLAAKKRQAEIWKQQEEMNIKILLEELENAKLEENSRENSRNISSGGKPSKH